MNRELFWRLVAIEPEEVYNHALHISDMRKKGQDMSKLDGYMPGWPPYTEYFCDACKNEIECDRYDPPLEIEGKHYCDKCFKAKVKSGELIITHERQEES